MSYAKRTEYNYDIFILWNYIVIYCWNNNIKSISFNYNYNKL